MEIRPYLDFDGRCEEAVEFYRRALGAEVLMLLRFKDSPDPDGRSMFPPGADDRVMHVTFRIGDTIVQASDGRCRGQPSFQGFRLLLSVPNRAEAERLFESLADGGRVLLPLTETFFSPGFGEVVDRFGVSWKINVD